VNGDPAPLLGVVDKQSNLICHDDGSVDPAYASLLNSQILATVDPYFLQYNSAAVQRQYELPLGVARSHYPNNECRLLAKRSDN
jgi:hypothetical protein